MLCLLPVSMDSHNDIVLVYRTGPAAQVNFMGYAKPTQNGHGIHLRLRARAFIMAEITSDRTMEIPHQGNQIGVRRHRGTEAISSQTDPGRAVCFVSADIGMGSDLLNLKVVQRLEELLPKQQGGKRLCHLENLSIR
jgi:Neutral/alkaline non-lysosomal ceramidase, N-terminal